jgi:choline-glycine betaine transporter
MDFLLFILILVAAVLILTTLLDTLIAMGQTLFHKKADAYYYDDQECGFADAFNHYYNHRWVRSKDEED